MITDWINFGGSAGAFRVGADRSVAHGGTSSGHITALSATPAGFGSFSQLIRPDEYRGKRVRYSAYVKTRNVSGNIGSSGAGLWMRVDGNGGILAFDNMQNRPVAGTTDWKLVSVVLDVPNDAAGITFGFLLASGGEAWVDDASLEVVSADVPSTNMMEPAPDASKAEQQRKIYEGRPLKPVNLGFEPR